ncbi:MAG: N-acetylmuramoyl-L-alanine amidase [Acidobacteriota bacterium]|nr:N-acetylmuramoyl-L-alanine amidase [Acidobacteriota bacterium]
MPLWAVFGLLLLLTSASLECFARTPASRKQEAASQFEKAEQTREALNGRPEEERTRRDYQRVADAYRKVYYVAPASSKADASVVAVAEILAEMGRQFQPGDKDLQSAIKEYEFLRREYPGSKYRFQALFTIGQIYKEDLGDEDEARQTFDEFLTRYPRNPLAREAKEALAELNSPKPVKKPVEQAHADPADASSSTDGTQPASQKKPGLPMVTSIRHWSTPDYTRVAIDLDREVQYETGRVPNPDRIFFDLPNTRLASILVGKSFDVQDGFLKKIRVAQYQPGSSRVVLEVADVSDYSAFLLPNPYRLIIDIHGRKSKSENQIAQSQGGTAFNDEDIGPNAIEQKKPPAPVTAKAPAKAPDSSPAGKAVQAADESGNAASGGATVASKPSDTRTPPRKVIIDENDNLARKTDTADTPAKKNTTTASKTSSKPAPVTTARKTDADDTLFTGNGDTNGSEVKPTTPPTTAPTAVAVAPRSKDRKKTTKTASSDVPSTREAAPTSAGERNLIRALGLKIGRIMIDAGHGGHDTGTIGPNGLQEKDLVLDVSLRLGRLLETRLGADVIYTRDDDTFIPLETRTALANEHQADLFISVHANSSHDPSARGVETYYLNFTSNPDALEVAARENAVSEKSIFELQDLVKKITLKEKIEESRELASDVQQSLYSGLGGKHSTLRDRGVKKAPFVVLIGANMPSILAEISFVSNPTDAAKLETPEYREKIAESLYKGIAKYAGGLSGVKVASKISKENSN